MNILMVAVCLLLFILLASSIRVLREYERAVVFNLGRFNRVKGPGLVLMLPFIQQMVISLRKHLVELVLPKQGTKSRLSERSFYVAR